MKSASKPAGSDRSGRHHSATSTASGNSASSIRRTSLQIAQVPDLFPSSYLTSEAAMSTRKPSQPWPSQKRITSFMASRVARTSRWSIGSCQGWRGSKKP